MDRNDGIPSASLLLGTGGLLLLETLLTHTGPFENVPLT